MVVTAAVTLNHDGIPRVLAQLSEFSSLFSRRADLLIHFALSCFWLSVLFGLKG